MYRQVLVEEPQNPDALHLLGVLAHQSGNNQAAVELIRRAIAVRPAAAYFTNLGVVLTDLRRLDEAVDAGRQAVALNPGSVEAVNNLANALREMDRLEEAVEFHRQAVVLNPNVADVHWNYAINLLALGNFAEGWPEFEWRLRPPGKNLDRGFSQPGWDGSDISDKTILLHAEGGFGDALHFVRYVPMVRRRGPDYFGMSAGIDFTILADKGCRSAHRPRRSVAGVRLPSSLKWPAAYFSDRP